MARPPYPGRGPMTPSEVYRITRQWSLHHPDDLSLLRYDNLRLSFPLTEGPDSLIVSGPNDLGNPDQVPEEYRDAFWRWFSSAEGALVLNLPLDPWVPLDEALWGGFCSGREGVTKLWDRRMTALGLACVWEQIKTALRSGCLDQEHLLTLLLQGQPSGRTLAPALQVLGHVLEGWVRPLGYDGRPLSWAGPPSLSAEWDGPGMWGDLRSALELKDWAQAVGIFETCLKKAQGPGGGAWRLLANRMAEYARPQLLPVLEGEAREGLSGLGFGNVLRFLSSQEEAP